MEVTRRFWTVTWAALVLALGSALFERPLLLYGAAAVGAWLLTTQYQFVRSIAALDDGLTVEVTPATTQIGTDDPVVVTLSVASETPADLAVDVTAEPPIGMDAPSPAERRVSLPPGTQTTTATFSIQSTVAGRYEFDPSTVAVTDSRGLFRETLRRGSQPTIRLRPRVPHNVHVGESGERIATAYGEHDTGRRGSGLEPTEIREYVAGDALSRIDWKATARFASPHVQEFETEADRTSVLLVDHRASMATGRPGETKLDYAREAALSFIQSARELDDPLGLYAVGDGGVTTAIQPRTTTSQYERLATVVTGISPTEEPGGPDGDRRQSPATARRAASVLRDDESAFARTLTPYLADSDPYIERIDTDPLFNAARTYLSRVRGTVWTVLLTDDTNRTEVHETVKLARRGENHVLVFLTPSGLFEPGGLSDLEAAYDRYLEFEQFRKQLGRHDRVHAFEVAPGDRIDSVLRANRRKREVKN
jgi:uncharacterized protein (DUF58 family)